MFKKKLSMMDFGYEKPKESNDHLDGAMFAGAMFARDSGADFSKIKYRYNCNRKITN